MVNNQQNSPAISDLSHVSPIIKIGKCLGFFANFDSTVNAFKNSSWKTTTVQWLTGITIALMIIPAYKLIILDVNYKIMPIIRGAMIAAFYTTAFLQMTIVSSCFYKNKQALVNYTQKLCKIIDDEKCAKNTKIFQNAHWIFCLICILVGLAKSVTVLVTRYMFMKNLTITDTQLFFCIAPFLTFTTVMDWYPVIFFITYANALQLAYSAMASNIKSNHERVNNEQLLKRYYAINDLASQLGENKICGVMIFNIIVCGTIVSSIAIYCTVDSVMHYSMLHVISQFQFVVIFITKLYILFKRADDISVQAKSVLTTLISIENYNPSMENELQLMALIVKISHLPIEIRVCGCFTLNKQLFIALQGPYNKPTRQLVLLKASIN